MNSRLTRLPEDNTFLEVYALKQRLKKKQNTMLYLHGYVSKSKQSRMVTACCKECPTLVHRIIQGVSYSVLSLR